MGGDNYLSVTGWLQAMSPDKAAVMTGGDNVVNLWNFVMTNTSYLSGGCVMH